LINYFWVVTCDVEADLNDVVATTALGYATTVRTAVNSNSFYLSVKSNIPTASSVDSVTASINTRHPTSQPTVLPSSVPTQVPKKKKKSSNEGANSAMMYMLVLLVIPFAAMGYVGYRYKMKIQEICFGKEPNNSDDGDEAGEGKKKNKKNKKKTAEVEVPQFKHHHLMDEKDKEWLMSVPDDMLRGFMLQAAVHRAKSQNFEMSKEQVEELRALAAAAAGGAPVPPPPPRPLGSPLGTALGASDQPHHHHHHHVPMSPTQSRIAARIAAEKLARHEKEEKAAQERMAAIQKAAQDKLNTTNSTSSAVASPPPPAPTIHVEEGVDV
jgi:hypothetical protein